MKDVELQKMSLILEKTLPFLPQPIVQFYYYVRMSNLSDYESKKLNYDPIRQFFKKLLTKETGQL